MTSFPPWEGITDPRVRAALEQVPRDQFVPTGQRAYASEDRPLPIGEGQTISQPFIVALMTQLLSVEPQHRVLEVGTGSGYQAAVLSLLAGEVFTVEVVPVLAERARRDLERLGYASNVHVRLGDGSLGWPEEAPFDGIIVTAAPARVPEALVEQLAEGGRLVIPVGREEQELHVLTRRQGRLTDRNVIPVRFVPLTSPAARA